MLRTGYFTFTTGLVGGETIQFADGRWPGVFGAGISMTEETFDLIEPHLRMAAPDWTSDHRYGVFELSASARRELAKRLRTEANMLRDPDATSALFNTLASWLEMRPEELQPVGVFGF